MQDTNFTKPFSRKSDLYKTNKDFFIEDSARGTTKTALTKAGEKKPAKNCYLFTLGIRSYE